MVTKLHNDLTLYSSPLPGSGVILAFILNILNGFIDMEDPWSARNWQRIVESFKFGYGRRTELGDIDGLDGVRIFKLLFVFFYRHNCLF